MYIVALDPGGTTGVCLVESDEDPWSVKVMQLGPQEHHAALLQHLTLWKPALIICEAFENRSQEAALLASVEYIGIVKLYVQTSDAVVVWQSASTAKQFWTDAKLKRYGLFASGLRHARDATRHYLYFRTFAAKDQSLLKGGASSRLELV